MQEQTKKPRARLPRLYENPYMDSELRTRESPASNNEVINKLMRAGAAIVAATSVAVAAESGWMARAVNSVLEGTKNAWTVPSVPGENATSIAIGDTIEYKTADGKTHKRIVSNLFDISAAAKSINPDIATNTFDEMLAAENQQQPGSNLVQPGQVFKVDGSLGIHDLERSGS